MWWNPGIPSQGHWHIFLSYLNKQIKISTDLSIASSNYSRIVHYSTTVDDPCLSGSVFFVFFFFIAVVRELALKIINLVYAWRLIDVLIEDGTHQGISVLHFSQTEMRSGGKDDIEIRAALEKHKLLPNIEENLIPLIGHCSDLENRKQQHLLFEIIKVILMAQRYQYKTQNIRIW